jgi:hypothetical protein
VKRHPDKDIRKAVAPALKAGATLEATNGGHFRLIQEGKESITMPATASDHRGIKNLMSMMRRFGYPVADGRRHKEESHA